jgi:hypothetical protein
MTTATATPRKRTTLWQLTIGHLIPREVSDLPAAIAEANAAAWHSWDRLQAAIADAREAAAVAEAAPRHDRVALEAALAADEKAPKPVAPAKSAQADAAKKAAAAADRVAKRDVRVLQDSVAEHYSEYLAVREAAFDAATERPRQLLEEFIASWDQVQTEGSLLREAKRFAQPGSYGLLASTGRRQTNRLAKAEKELARQRPGSDVRNRFEHLVVALRRLVEAQADVSRH